MPIERFDEIEYQVLDSATKGNYMINATHVERAELLMCAGILVQDDMNGWMQHGMRLTPAGRVYYAEFMTAVQAKHGHEWITDESGKVNIWAYESGEIHNGPRCKKCGYGFCHHCQTEMDIPACTNKAIHMPELEETTLTGRFGYDYDEGTYDFTLVDQPAYILPYNAKGNSYQSYLIYCEPTVIVDRWFADYKQWFIVQKYE